MEGLIESIRAALVPEATEETRSAGALACRTILTALEAKPGEPLAAPVATPASPIATVVSALRGMPAEQILDLAIARLRAALPEGTEPPPKVQPLKFHIVPVPHRG